MEMKMTVIAAAVCVLLMMAACGRVDAKDVPNDKCKTDGTPCYKKVSSASVYQWGLCKGTGETKCELLPVGAVCIVEVNKTEADGVVINGKPPAKREAPPTPPPDTLETHCEAVVCTGTGKVAVNHACTDATISGKYGECSTAGTCVAIAKKHLCHVLSDDGVPSTTENGKVDDDATYCMKTPSSTGSTGASTKATTEATKSTKPRPTRHSHVPKYTGTGTAPTEDTETPKDCGVPENYRLPCKGGKGDLDEYECVDAGCCYNGTQPDAMFGGEIEATTATTPSAGNATCHEPAAHAPTTTEGGGKSKDGFEMLGLPMMPLLLVVSLAAAPALQALLSATHAAGRNKGY